MKTDTWKLLPRTALMLAVALMLALALRLYIASLTSPSVAKAAPLALGAPSVPGKILYVRDHELWLHQGSNDRRFTQSGGLAMQPAWSPDGSEIAYVLRRKNSSDFAIMNADGTGTRLMSNNESSIVDNNLWAFSPTWSTDGKQIAFLTDRGRGASGVIDLAVWTMNLTSRQVRELREPAPYSGGDADPAWRPEHPGQMVYTHYAYADNGTSVYSQLILLNVLTMQSVALTPTTESAYQPTWSPHGDAIAYVKRSTDQDDIYAAPVPDWPAQDMNTAGTALINGVTAQPVWSPDGLQILFIGESGDSGFDLWTTDISVSSGIAVNGKPTQITSGQQVDATSRPSWIP